MWNTRNARPFKDVYRAKIFLTGCLCFFFYIDIRQKTHTHLADRLELFIFFIVTSQQEAPIGACPFSFPQIGPNHTQVHCVSNSLQVVLLQLGEDNSKREIHSCINHPMFWSLFNTGK